MWDYATHVQHVRDIYRVKIDITYQIYQLVGGFPAKFVSSRISHNIFFHMIGNKSFNFIFLRGGRFQIWSLLLNLEYFLLQSCKLSHQG